MRRSASTALPPFVSVSAIDSLNIATTVVSFTSL